MYFKNFPKIDYEFSTENGKLTIRMQDMFRRVALTKKTLNTSTNFLQHIVNDGDTPDQVAFDVYGDSALWWVVLLSNGIVDLDNDWAKGSNEIKQLFSKFLDGTSYYFMENLDIKKDDVIVKRDPNNTGSIDLNTWGIINDYDPFLHKIDVKTKESEGSFSSGDEFYAYHTTDYGLSKIGGFGLTACAIQGCGGTACVQIVGPISDTSEAQGPYCATAGSTFGIIRRSETIKSGLSFFEHKDDTLNPYSIIDGGSPGGTTCDFYKGEGNLCGMTATLLYKWITNDFPVNSGVKAISKGADIIRKNDDKRIIKLLTPQVLNNVVKEFHSMINNSVPPGLTEYITIL